MRYMYTTREEIMKDILSDMAKLREFLTLVAAHLEEDA